MNTAIIATIVCSLILIAVSIIVTYKIASKSGYEKRKREAELAIGGAENEAKRILSDATKAAESNKREILLEAQ